MLLDDYVAGSDDWDLVLDLDKLAEEEELEVAEAELTQWLMSQAQRYQMAPDQFANALVEAGPVPPPRKGSHVV